MTPFIVASLSILAYKKDQSKRLIFFVRESPYRFLFTHFYYYQELNENQVWIFILQLTQKTWTEINNDIAQKIVRLRKRKKITQKQLAARSGVSLGSLKRFEQIGEISLQSLTKIAIALDVENELEGLFDNVPFASIEEVINEQTK